MLSGQSKLANLYLPTLMFLHFRKFPHSLNPNRPC